jgi:hypothetical protein
MALKVAYSDKMIYNIRRKNLIDDHEPNKRSDGYAESKDQAYRSASRLVGDFLRNCI